MNAFALTEDQIAIRDMARDFAAEKLAPHAVAWDEEKHFPVDVMREAHRGRIIGVDVAAAPEGLSADDFINPPGFFGWTLKHGFKSPPPIANLLMRAATVSMNPNQHRAITDSLIAPELQGVELRDWKKYEPTVDAGYLSMKEALADVKGPLAQIIRGNAAAVAD